MSRADARWGAAQAADPYAGLTFAERRRAQRAVTGARQARLTAVVFAIAFLVFVFLSVSLVHWKVASLPVRSLYGVALLGLLLVACPARSAIAFRKHRYTMALVIAFAVLGGLVSALNDAPPATVARQLTEIHLQAIVNLAVAAVIVEVSGAKAVLGSFLAVIGLSMAVAILQGLGLEPAWALRDAFGATLDLGEYDRSRPAGLSMNPVLLGSQTCLGVAALYMYRRYSAPTELRRVEPDLLAWCAFGLAVAVISGTRSPILGLALFLAVYMTRRFGAWAIVAALVTVAAIPVFEYLFAHLQGSGARAFQTGDKSAVGRWPLLAYGVRLFLDNPLGYGLGFDPTKHWADHWSALSRMDNAVVIARLDLHNYVLNTLNKYGAGIFLLLPFVIALVRRHRFVLLGFAPYALHILFHNDGPLDADYMFWFVVALTSMALPANQVPGRRIR